MKITEKIENGAVQLVDEKGVIHASNASWHKEGYTGRGPYVSILVTKTPQAHMAARKAWGYVPPAWDVTGRSSAETSTSWGRREIDSLTSALEAMPE